MYFKRILATAGLLAVFGLEPVTVHAAVKPGPFRFAIVDQNDSPKYILINNDNAVRNDKTVRHGRRLRAKRHYRKILIIRRSRMPHPLWV